MKKKVSLRITNQQTVYTKENRSNYKSYDTSFFGNKSISAFYEINFIFKMGNTKLYINNWHLSMNLFVA